MLAGALISFIRARLATLVRLYCLQSEMGWTFVPSLKQ
jgi:hypothetical protein